MRLFKVRLPGKVIKLASRFIDIEASGETALPDARVIEYSFIIGRLSQMKPGKVLDVGCAARLNFLPAALASLGWQVWGIDRRKWKFEFPNFHFVQGDIRETVFPDNFFDCIYAVSTLEHIGLSGRYGITEDDERGDFKAVKEISRILRGRFLVTLPYGENYRLIKPQKRVYDRQRVEDLFHEWEVNDKIFYIQDNQGYWIPISEEQVCTLKEGKEVVALLDFKNSGEL
ncbi:class I SAM-dependent methyltransferase [Dehalococcoidia bacterium]|nr:class I SAM-dependent methyltransferase [Dehalococcoidia bacterium]